MDGGRKKHRGLADWCQYLRGVGPARAERLRKLGIETVNDLLTHFPRTYYDRRNLATISKLQLGEEASFLARVLTVAQPGTRRGRSRVTAAVGDDTGAIQVVWFNQPYIARHLKPGAELIVTGVLSYYRGARQLVNPEFERLGDGLGSDLIHTGRIVPVYPLTQGVSQRFLRELVSRALQEYEADIHENLPASLCREGNVCSRVRALKGVHFPEDRAHYREALARLKLEELFYLQLILARQRHERAGQRDRPRLGGAFRFERKFLDGLPYELTGAQRRVLDDIHADLRSEHGMHRLLQGDVGSGKTVVAAAALLAAVESGYQAAFMAPTEILAVQHARTLQAFFRPAGVGVRLLIGSLPASEKRAVRSQIAGGDVPVVVGTHALIQADVKFDKLAVVVIDEQHRFGVRQRAALLTRNHNPHMLVMTATPIPRTLAMTAYADLDLSVIDEMPPGRREVTTRIVAPGKREAMYRFVRDHVERGGRAYFLYPVINETEKQDLEAAVTAYQELSTGLYRGVPMGLLHGRMAFEEKERVMEEFAGGAIRLLVTTTVVEVGVHVPEATIMAVHHPERFGLSQLHQLRGRVGRGREAGYCFLLVGDGAPNAVRERLHVLTRVSDGFRIAEEDLKIRGPGEFLGVRQHGVPGLKVANPATDRRQVELARGHVKRLIETDPGLQQPDARPCREFLRDTDAGSPARTVA